MTNEDRLRNFANPCAAPLQMMQIAAAFCLSPMLDRDEEPEPESAELLADIKQIKRDLKILFSDDMRRQLISFIRQIDENRDLYRRTLLLWLDLTEEIALQVELDLGDGTGPVKLKRVRGGMFYLLTKFSQGLEAPGVPRFFNRLVISMAIRGTVEFIITLVNIDQHEQTRLPAVDLRRSDELGLWNQPLKARRKSKAQELEQISKSRVKRVTYHVRDRTRRVSVSVEKHRERLSDRIMNCLLDFLYAPPKVPAAFRMKIDRIVEQMNQEAPAGMPPITMLGRWFFDVIIWIGRHGKEVRAAIDVFSIAVHRTQLMSEMSRERRLRIIEDALISYFDELGLSGPYFQFVLRLVVDINLDGLVFLYKKRGVIDEAPAMTA